MPRDTFHPHREPPGRDTFHRPAAPLGSPSNQEPARVTDTELAEWQALADAATEGPWFREYDRIVKPRFALDGEYEDDLIAKVVSEVPISTNPKHYADPDFIAAARTAVPALIAEVRSQQSRIDEQAEQIERLTADLAWMTDDRNIERASCNVAEAALAAEREALSIKSEESDRLADMISGLERDLAAEREKVAKAAHDIESLAELYLYDSDTDQPVNDGYGALYSLAAALSTQEDDAGRATIDP